jgi:L-cysteate sulfo-lyase
MNTPIDVIGISVRANRAQQIASVHRLAAATAEMIGARGALPESMVETYDDYVGSGYGQPTDSMVDAISMLAREEGIFLDPVYSSKSMAGMIGLINKGILKKGENVVFIHTGGAAALPAYEHLFTKQTAA